MQKPEENKGLHGLVPKQGADEPALRDLQPQEGEHIAQQSATKPAVTPSTEKGPAIKDSASPVSDQKAGKSQTFCLPRYGHVAEEEGLLWKEGCGVGAVPA